MQLFSIHITTKRLKTKAILFLLLLGFFQLGQAQGLFGDFVQVGSGSGTGNNLNPYAQFVSDSGVSTIQQLSSANGGVMRYILKGETFLQIFPSVKTGTMSMTDMGVGLGTNTPLKPLHIHANSIFPEPTLRLDNNGKAWDLNSNNMGKFHIDDVANTKTVVTILPGSGNLGAGTTEPVAPVHVVRDDGKSQVRVEELIPGNGVETSFSLICNTCTPSFRFNQRLPMNQTWFFRMLQNGNFSVDDPSSIAKEAEFRSGGDLKIGGTLIQASSREIKNNFVELNNSDILNKIDQLPITQWSYIKDQGKVKHIGPVAEDFYKAFRLGDTAKGISSVDTAGVALAAIKALNRKVTEKDSEIAALRNEMAELKQAVAQLIKKETEFQVARLSY